jgi:hypothetical protein
MIVTNKNQARWYKEISFRALPEQNVKLRGDKVKAVGFYKKVECRGQSGTDIIQADS